MAAMVTNGAECAERQDPDFVWPIVGLWLRDAICRLGRFEGQKEYLDPGKIPAVMAKEDDAEVF